MLDTSRVFFACSLFFFLVFNLCGAPLTYLLDGKTTTEAKDIVPYAFKSLEGHLREAARSYIKAGQQEMISHLKLSHQNNPATNVVFLTKTSSDVFKSLCLSHTPLEVQNLMSPTIRTHLRAQFIGTRATGHFDKVTPAERDAEFMGWIKTPDALTQFWTELSKDIDEDDGVGIYAIFPPKPASDGGEDAKQSSSHVLNVKRSVGPTRVWVEMLSGATDSCTQFLHFLTVPDLEPLRRHVTMSMLVSLLLHDAPGGDGKMHKKIVPPTTARDLLEKEYGLPSALVEKILLMMLMASNTTIGRSGHPLSSSSCPEGIANLVRFIWSRCLQDEVYKFIQSLLALWTVFTAECKEGRYCDATNETLQTKHAATIHMVAQWSNLAKSVLEGAYGVQIQQSTHLENDCKSKPPRWSLNSTAVDMLLLSNLFKKKSQVKTTFDLNVVPLGTTVSFPIRLVTEETRRIKSWDDMYTIWTLPGQDTMITPNMSQSFEYEINVQCIDPTNSVIELNKKRTKRTISIVVASSDKVTPLVDVGERNVAAYIQLVNKLTPSIDVPVDVLHDTIAKAQAEGLLVVDGVYMDVHFLYEAKHVRTSKTCPSAVGSEFLVPGTPILLTVRMLTEDEEAKSLQEKSTSLVAERTSTSGDYHGYGNEGVRPLNMLSFLAFQNLYRQLSVMIEK